MNTFIIPLFLFVFIATNLYAETKEKKWIPIQPINLNETTKPDSNKSKPLTSPTMTQKMQVIKNLLDHVTKEGINTEHEKNWYSMEPTEE
ncbi:MAG: hypothetical protein JZU62_09420 [Sulfuricurvum sp.]|uniref:hypothetical protein n=1 Tax=Sulfuricurvum sp. TaxID=2025608 RepID=UPI0025EFDC5A|nr:hypothetical protein [Sulfuricurvum sp.]MBV5321896.1 hypothetical protein [Sulfuricurvum sp.]